MLVGAARREESSSATLGNVCESWLAMRTLVALLGTSGVTVNGNFGNQQSFKTNYIEI